LPISKRRLLKLQKSKDLTKEAVMKIDWNQIGDQPFNVFDRNFGFWTDDGFTRHQLNAKRYTQEQLTHSEREAIETGPCTLVSA
jgi:hypothetical protein